MGETIAAISTALGEGGIGVIRISGEDSLNIMEKIFLPIKGKINYAKIKPRYVYYGNVIDYPNDNVVDEVLCIYMKAPHTYTCEDVVEIQTHGSIVSLKKIIGIVLNSGARMAEPGEFTKLAFLNGRMDLSQAEAVIDIIKAKTDKPFEIAIDQLEGKLSREIKKLREELLGILAQLAVNIDYPDEDIEQFVYEEIIKKLNSVDNSLKRLISSAETGRLAKEGIKVAIAGKPNVGKSSMMNALLNEERAIVTAIPGTTRDTIEEATTVKGIPIIFTDTAGIRKTENEIEKIGIGKSLKELNKADLVMLILDGSREIEDLDNEIIDKIKDKNVLIVVNKSDLGKAINLNIIKNVFKDSTIIETSIIKPNSADEIKNQIFDMFVGGEIIQGSSNIITNARQKEVITKAERALSDGIVLAKKEEALEIIEIDIHNSYDFLGEIIGETAGEEILDAVFSKFCLGK